MGDRSLLFFSVDKHIYTHTHAHRHLTLSASSRSFNRPFLEALGSPHAKLPHLQELVLNMGPADTVVTLPHLQMAKGSLSSLHSLFIKSDLPWSFLGTLLQDACVSEDGTSSKLMRLSLIGGSSRQRTIDALWSLLAKANTFSPPWLHTLRSLTVQGHTDYHFWEFCGYTIGHATEMIGREMRAGLARLPALESLNVRARKYRHTETHINISPVVSLSFLPFSSPFSLTHAIPTHKYIQVQLNLLDAFFISFMSLREEGALANIKILRTSFLPFSSSYFGPPHTHPVPPAHTHISTAAQLLFLRWLKKEREGLARDLKVNICTCTLHNKIYSTHVHKLTHGTHTHKQALDFPIFEYLPPALARAICDVFPTHDTIEM